VFPVGHDLYGAPDAPRMKRIIDGVVRGIGGYGNCVGVPTVGGEVNFHPAYNGNPLVNAMTVGIADQDGHRGGLRVPAPLAGQQVERAQAPFAGHQLVPPVGFRRADHEVLQHAVDRDAFGELAQRGVVERLARVQGRGVDRGQRHEGPIAVADDLRRARRQAVRRCGGQWRQAEGVVAGRFGGIPLALGECGLDLAADGAGPGGGGGRQVCGAGGLGHRSLPLS
jgi:hypothetical protein